MDRWLMMGRLFTAGKVSVFRVILVRIFPPNVGKYGPE